MKDFRWLLFLVMLIILVKIVALPIVEEDTNIPQIPFATLIENPVEYDGTIVETRAYVCSCEFFLFRSITFIAENEHCEKRVLLLSKAPHSSTGYITLKAKLILLHYSSSGPRLYFFKEARFEHQKAL